MQTTKNPADKSKDLKTKDTTNTAKTDSTNSSYRARDNSNSPDSDRERDQETWNKNEVDNKQKMYTKGSDPKDRKGMDSNREKTDDEESIE